LGIIPVCPAHRRGATVFYGLILYKQPSRVKRMMLFHKNINSSKRLTPKLGFT